MRICWVVLLGSSACLVEATDVEHETMDDSAILGGTNAAPGAWPDVAAVMWDGMPTCTGTLIAPNVVLTAGHCNDPSLDRVLIGTTSLARATEGQTVAVARRHEYPSSQSSEDVTVLVLNSPARFAPRPVATGWARLAIQNGARVEIAGYGAIDRNASQFKNELQRAETTITDFDCSTKPGCNPSARPAGELGAGGDMGIDTCNGDSGGPLYVLTDFGAFLAGVTSRGYEGAASLCGEGGIYARPDKIVDWIEAQAGTKVARAPEPTFEQIRAVRGGDGETRIEYHDPLSDEHTLTVKQPPMQGAIATRDDGRVRICLGATASGVDTAIVTITDRRDPARALDVTIPITVTDGVPSGTCDVEAFSDDGGCCDAGGSARGSLPLGLAVVLVLRRRRRR